MKRIAFWTIALVTTLSSVAPGQSKGGARSLPDLPMFPAPIRYGSIPLSQALGLIGSQARHGYMLFGLEIGSKDGSEPVVNLKVEPPATFAGAFEQIISQLPGYRWELVSPHLINIYPEGAKKDPNDILNMKIKSFDVVSQNAGLILVTPWQFIPKLGALLSPKGYFIATSPGPPGPANVTVHLKDVTLRQILNAVSEATEQFPADGTPLGWVYRFQPNPKLPAGGEHSWTVLGSAPREWKEPAPN